MTQAGYPATGKPADLLNEQDLDRVIADHFSAPEPRYKDAIDAIRTAIDDLDGAAKDTDEAAKAVEGTTHGYMLQTAANEIREEIEFLTRLQERMRRMTA